MNAQKTGRLLSLLAGVAAVSMTAAHAAGTPAPAKPAPAKAAAPAPTVTVKLGDAILEEYHNGDPAARTTILRGTDAAPQPKHGGGKKQS